MLLIVCPWCGARDEDEFAYGGQSHVDRPAPPEAVSDADWGEYLFYSDNPKGWRGERWLHAHGCRQWFNAVRHTVTHQIACTYPMGDPAPDPAALPSAEGRP